MITITPQKVATKIDTHTVVAVAVMVFLVSTALAATLVVTKISNILPRAGTPVNSLAYTGVYNGPFVDSTYTSQDKATNVPGEIIIKFKEKSAALIDRNLNPQTMKPSPGQTGLPSVNALNSKYKIKDIAPVFKELKVKQLQTNKSYKQLFAETKSKFTQRAKRVPKNTQIPNLTNIYKLELQDENADILAICEEYKKDPNVEYCEPNYIATVFTLPNDTYVDPSQKGTWSTGAWAQAYSNLWGLEKIKMKDAWTITKGSPDVIVAVSDTGIDYNHPDLAVNVWINIGEVPNNSIDDDGNGYIDDVRGWNFVSRNNNPVDDYGHGTHVAGTIAANTNNGIGVAGVCPDCKIMAVKGLDSGGSGYDDDLAATITYAADNGADIINMSWGGQGNSQLITVAVEYAYSQGVILVAAAGNSNLDVNYFFPAKLPQVITVAATDNENARAYFSNWGDKIDVAAPGVQILSLRAAGTDMYAGASGYKPGANFVPAFDASAQYYRSSGTSMAAPHVAGAAALLLTRKPSFTNEDIRQVLRGSADDLATPGFDVYTGAGLINLSRALNLNYVSYASISSPASESIIMKSNTTSLPINGNAFGSTFLNYQLFWGTGKAPVDWLPISDPIFTPVNNGILVNNWNIEALLPGEYVIKLVVTTQDGYQFQDIKTIYLDDSIQITSNTRRQRFPKISSLGKIVFAEYTTESAGYFYLYDLISKRMQVISNSVIIYPPDISDKIVAWDADDAIKIYNLATQLVEHSLSPDFPWLSVSGNNVIYNLHLYDNLIDKSKQIKSVFGWAYMNDISEKFIAFQYRDAFEEHHLGIYDLTSDTERQIAIESKPYNGSWGYLGVSISGQRVVWSDLRNDSNGACYSPPWSDPDCNADIYMYDIATDTEQRITTNTKAQTDPVISGNRIVWQDNRNGNWDIYVYDLTTGQEQQVSTGPGWNSEETPDISSFGIVWQDDRNGNWDIYFRKFPGNQYPYITPIGDKSVNFGNALTFRINASDPEGDTLTYSVDSLPQGASFNPATHIFSWSPTSADIGLYDLIFSVTDSYGNYTSQNVTISVLNRPYLNTIGNKSIVVGKTISFDVKAEFPDNPITLIATGLPAGATLSEPDSGTSSITRTFTWEPTSLGTYAVIFTATDNFGASSSETITITVTPNNPPVINPIGSKTVTANNTLSFTVTATDSDNEKIDLYVNKGDLLSLPGLSFPPTSGIGSVSSTFSWNPASAGSFALTFFASDAKALTRQMITITVNNPIPPPACFLGGTSILMTDGTSKSIEKVKVGDLIMSYDEVTKQLKPDKIKKVFRHNTDQYLVINGQLEVTANHLVYSDGQWVEIGQLKIGDNLLNFQGKPEKITSIEIIKKVVQVYNLEVNSYHTYIAGGVVVHNKAAPPPKLPEVE
ncbi:MAG: S8 family serine peptidase [Patescibacteria group bacterium]